MAIYNEILAPRYSRFLQKLLSMKGAPGMNQLAGEMMAVIQMSSGAENRYLEGWAMHSFETVIAASVGNLNASMVRNPTGSNIVAVFVKVTVTGGLSAGDQFIMSLGPRTTDLPTPITLAAPSNFDTRFGTTNRSVLLASIQQSAGPGTAPPDRAIASCPANSTYDFILDVTEEIPLLPGTAISIRNTVTNINNTFTYWWRERAMEDSELF